MASAFGLASRYPKVLTLGLSPGPKERGFNPWGMASSPSAADPRNKSPDLTKQRPADPSSSRFSLRSRSPKSNPKVSPSKTLHTFDGVGGSLTPSSQPDASPATPTRNPPPAPAAPPGSPQPA